MNLANAPAGVKWRGGGRVSRLFPGVGVDFPLNKPYHGLVQSFEDLWPRKP